jgi:predicted RNase H-like HicB family nuclease
MVSTPPAYSMRVFWSEEDAAFVAVCPELRTVSAFGGTYEEAVKELRAAIQGAVEVYQSEGWPLPETYTEEGYSGQLRVRMPKSLHARLAEEAQREDVSLNTLIVTRLGESSAAIAAARHTAQNPVNGKWTKRDTDTGRFIDQKQDGHPLKGVRREK